MSRITFLTSVPDAVTPTTIYGVGHQMDMTDEAQVYRLNAQGKVALMGATIRNVRVTAVGTTTATIAFTVDQPCTAMAANYGTSTSYGSTQAATPASGSGDIVVNLTGLTTATLYHYRITVTVGTAVTLTGDQTFTTA